MKSNMGTVDRFIRLTAGFYLLGVGIKKSSKLLMLTGSMSIAKGVTKWCPILHVLNKKTKNPQIEPEKEDMREDSYNTEIPIM